MLCHETYFNIYFLFASFCWLTCCKPCNKDQGRGKVFLLSSLNCRECYRFSKNLLETLHCSVLPKLDYFYSQTHSQINILSQRRHEIIIFFFHFEFFYLTFLLPRIPPNLLYGPENTTQWHTFPQTKIWEWTLPYVFVRNIKAHRNSSLSSRAIFISLIKNWVMSVVFFRTKKGNTS